MFELPEKAKALFKAVATWLPAIQSLLTWAAVEVVPRLPDHLAVQAAAVLVVVAGWVAIAVRLVSTVMPAPVSTRGLLMPDDRVIHMEVINAAGKVVETHGVARV